MAEEGPPSSEMDTAIARFPLSHPSSSHSGASSSTTSTSPSVTSKTAKHIWCMSQWANLTMQAKALGLPKEPYFNPRNGMLSKDVNEKLWRQIENLYTHLGPAEAPLATPVMLEGGKVEWHSFRGGDKGRVVEIVTR